MRGQQAITSNFPVSIDTKSTQKGHRNVHLERRDTVLATRFYYYHEIMRYRYDDCLAHLETEFFITTLVIAQRLSLQTATFKLLIKEQAKAADLKKRYPLYTWTVPTNN